MDIDFAMRHWLRWRDRIEELEIKRACGVKPYGLEYRLMVEAKMIMLDPKKPYLHEQLVHDVDLVWRRIHSMYPAHMKAIELFYLRKKSFRAVRLEMNWSQHMARKMVDQGQDMMIGGLAAIAGFQDDD